MKYFLLILALLVGSLQIAAQTRAELDAKYGPIEGNRYKIRPGIAAEVTFSENGKVKTIRIVPDDPKNKDALLRPENVRQTISELVPGRICRAPLSYSKTETPCPPRKVCRAFQEVWKRATTLMVWYKKSVASSLITLNNELIPPPGNIKLLPGYEHTPGCGIDTTVGHIIKDGGLDIGYNIGSLAGNFASRYSNPDLTEWIRTEKVGEDSVLIVLTKQKRIIATFEKDVANFTSTVASQSDIDDFLTMVLSFNPVKRK
jgi:hypothetical protein